MVNPPVQYNYLTKPFMPKPIQEAMKLFGIHEGVGDFDNPVILGWAKEIGSLAGMPYDHDEIPWCGLFMAVCMQRAGYRPPVIAVRASSWDAWGDKADKPRLGDVLRFQRPGGGHVGMYVAEDNTCYHVLGGNQADQVCIERITKDRCVAVRRAWGVTSANTPIIVAADGTISENEA